MNSYAIVQETVFILSFSVVLVGQIAEEAFNT